MKNRTWVMGSATVALVGGIVGGCVATTRSGGTGSGNGAVPVAISLNGEVAAFNVTAGAPTEKTILIDLPVLDFTVSGGTFALAPDVISFEEAGAGGKGRVAAQAGPFDFDVTGFVFSRDPLGACGDGDTYGPYTLSVDADGQATSVDPSELELLPDTIDLINAGNIAICLRVESPVTGTIRIRDMRFNLTAGTTEVGP